MAEYKKFKKMLIKFGYEEENVYDIRNQLLDIINKGADLNNATEWNFPSDTGQTTPLVWACEYRLATIVKLLLELGANPNIRDKSGFSPLGSALIGHSARDMLDETTDTIAGLLLSNGAESQFNEDEMSHISGFEASDYEQFEFIKRCIGNNNK